MGNEDLKSYIRKCANKEINAPIKLVNDEILKLGMNLLVNKSKSEIIIFDNFDTNQVSTLILDALNNDLIIKSVIDFLNIPDAKIVIYTNGKKFFKESKFFKAVKTKNIKVKLIPKATYDRLTEPMKLVHFISSDSKATVIGSLKEETLEASELFVNFGDEEGSTLLKSFSEGLNDAIFNNQGMTTND